MEKNINIYKMIRPGFSWVLIGLLCLTWAMALYAQQGKEPLLLSCSKADLVIQDEKRGFGALPTRVLFLDFNHDGVKDLAVIGGGQTNPLGIGKRNYLIKSGAQIDFFDGRTLREMRSLTFKDASLTLWAGGKVFGTDAGYQAGDFNGDGCADLLVGTLSEGIVRFHVFLGSPDFFSNKIPDAIAKHGKRDFMQKLVMKQSGKARILYFSEFADHLIFSSAERDFYDEAVGYPVGLGFFNVNHDGKDDIVVFSAYANTRNPQGGKVKDAGKIFVLLGKEDVPKEIDLQLQADLTIYGNSNANLGKQIWSGRLASGNNAQVTFFVKGNNRLYIIPDMAKLKGDQSIDDIPDAVELVGEGDFFQYTDFNGDGKPDLVVSATFSDEMKEQWESREPVAYQTNLKSGAYPLLRVIYGRDTPLASKKHLNELADIMVVCHAGKGTEEIEPLLIGDFNDNGKPDALFREWQKGDKDIFYLLTDLADKGAVIDLKNADRITDVTSDFTRMVYGIDLDGNLKAETVITNPRAPHKKGYLPLEACGKVYVCFNRDVAYDLMVDADNYAKLILEADLVIAGEEKNDNFGTEVYGHDVSGDGVDDLIVLAPFKDTKKAFMQKNFRSALYVFFGETLRKLMTEKNDGHLN